ncbi:MAG TPA: CAAX prenyl protease-related protein [Bryobacteraceae bacterium]|nr:CAAX prenyl protease-related protein [Bryobacteraceae bacterium]
MIAYVAPFVVFIALRWLPIAPEWLAPVRFMVVAATIAVFSRRVLPRRLLLPAGSALVGAAVLAIWIAPDALWPGYRDFWLFHNSITGAARSTLPARLHGNAAFIVVRVVESALLVPVLEELFWRGWLMRWLIRSDFEKAPLGQYTAFSFWGVAVLFALEHGPYWEVGLAAGVAYNWWMVRTRSLADCMLAHGVTNALLAGYVLMFHQWQYWL